jgi:hypothetical protein
MSRGNQNKEELVLAENARSAAGAPLPSIAPGQGHEHAGTILLFYQYQEPVWTAKQHKQVLKDVIVLGQTHNITGRGRVAPEGLNCTLSGSPNDIRAFCQGLRDYDKLFLNTDFKLTDGVPLTKLFKSLSIRKTNELVAYGLSGEKAPLLSKFAGEHLQAKDYHKAMASDNTVIIDVRNAYESAIGNFAPPPGGAELIDPQMRNSIEFPKWLADERTQKKLHGKKVLMYCTGKLKVMEKQHGHVRVLYYTSTPSLRHAKHMANSFSFFRFKRRHSLRTSHSLGQPTLQCQSQFQTRSRLRAPRWH